MEIKVEEGKEPQSELHHNSGFPIVSAVMTGCSMHPKWPKRRWAGWPWLLVVLGSAGAGLLAAWMSGLPIVWPRLWG